MLNSKSVGDNERTLKDERESMAMRFRALFDLGEESIDTIGQVLLRDESALLKHECAYKMGQMKDPRSIPFLIEAIKDENQHPMVRHEAGEALGAIGKSDDDVVQILKNYSEHHVPELSETCQLALDRLAWYSQKDKQNEESKSIYDTVDPTPSYPNSMPISKLREIYLDETKNLFERYRALFTLRNINTQQSIDVICEGLFGSPSDSALFKHEVAFVLGQIQNLKSSVSLEKKLAELEENEIVRHECAEALGSIGKSDVIQQYLKDHSRIVRESCEVALDMAECA